MAAQTIFRDEERNTKGEMRDEHLLNPLLQSSRVGLRVGVLVEVGVRERTHDCLPRQHE